MVSSSDRLHNLAWMSLWDKYLAPGDLRRGQKVRSSESQDGSRPNEQPGQSPFIVPQLDAAQRVRRQNGLLFGGLAFTFLSLFITRRALRRKQLQDLPKKFTPSNSSPTNVDGGLEAFEALYLATLNVGSFFMLGIGAAMKYFDIADIEDLRQAVRRGTGNDTNAGESDADREIEEWIAKLLSRKDGKGDLTDEDIKKRSVLAEVEKTKGGQQQQLQSQLQSSGKR